MDINRNQWFLTGLVILFLGIQFRLVDKYVLNEQATTVINRRIATGQAPGMANILPANGPAARRVFQPPEWLGWATVSVGSVLILHSLAMKRPD